MRCPICDQKAPNCDCTATERAQHSLLEDAIYEIDLRRAEIARLREERRWIAVTERLPPDNVAVLVNHDSGGVEMAFREGGRWNISHAGVSVPDCSYTHWMPLPAPPSEGEVE